MPGSNVNSFAFVPDVNSFTTLESFIICIVAPAISASFAISFLDIEIVLSFTLLYKDILFPLTLI